MTTMPHRINNLKPVIDLILKTGIDWLEFNIPEKSIRSGAEYIIPSWLLTMENVRIFRTPDYGPLTKVLPTFQRHQHDSGHIISFDDDTLYNPGLVDKQRPLLRNNEVLAGSIDIIDHFIFFYGYATVVYPMQIYTDSDFSYFETLIKDQKCFESDDIILTNFVNKKGYIIGTPFPLYIAIGTQLQSGITDSLALYRTNGATSDKIASVIKYLANINMLYPKITRYGFSNGKLKCQVRR